MRVAGRLQTGICHINAPTVHDEPQMPFGGVKSSGHGREKGFEALYGFSVTKTIAFKHG